MLTMHAANPSCIHTLCAHEILLVYMTRQRVLSISYIAGDSKYYVRVCIMYGDSKYYVYT